MTFVDFVYNLHNIKKVYEVQFNLILNKDYLSTSKNQISRMMLEIPHRLEIRAFHCI